MGMAKTKRELDREISEILAARSGLSRHHRYLLSQGKPAGRLGAGYLTPAGWHGDPLQIEDPKLRLAALREQPAPRLPRSRQHSSIKAHHAPKPELTVRQLNAIVRASDGRNVYLIRQRLDEETIQRVIRARTRGREMEVRSLATGNWIPVLPERGDRLEVR